MHVQSALRKEEAQIGIAREQRNVDSVGYRKPVCAVPGEGAVCGSETEQGNRDLRNLTLGGACGECHFVSAGGQDIQTEAVVCPFIGTDVRQIDRKIAIQFIKFDGRFVHIRLVCRTIDNIDLTFCAKQPVKRMGVHEETADVGGTTLQFAALQGAIFQRGENVVVILCAAGAYHVNIVLCHCHRGEVGLVDCLSAAVDLCPPVGHGKAGKAPVVSQDLCGQIVVGSRPDTVDRSVGCHNGVRIALLYGNLKALEIDFAKSTLGDHGIRIVTVGLLVVSAEMLDRSGDTGAVKSF